MPEDIKQSDHDSIVTLIAEVRQITKSIMELKVDIKDIKDDLVGRISHLEESKADKIDHADLVKKIEFLQMVAYSGLALLGAVQFYFSYLHK